MDEVEKISTPTEEIFKLSAFELAKQIRQKKLTCLQATLAYINQLKKWNAFINAVAEARFEIAINEARSYDLLISKGQINWQQKSLLGVPFTCKEMLAVEGLKCTSGAKRLKDQIASQTATTIKRLQDQGAILIATSNVPEVGMWFECHNPIYGVTKNPYDLSRTSGGSSGGEGALVGSSSSCFGIGSDLGGSIRMPAGFCGIFGHKPSERIIPITGHIPIFHDLIETLPDKSYPFVVIGPMAKRAKDLRPILKLLMGTDGLDRKVIDLKLQDPVTHWQDYTVYTLPSPKIHGTTETEHEISNAVVQAGRYLQQMGAQTKKFPVDLFKRSFDIWTGRSWDIEDRDFITHLTGETSIDFVFEFKKLFLNKGNYTLPSLMTALFDQNFKDESQKDEFLKELATVKQKLGQILGMKGILLMPNHPRLAPKIGSTLLRPLDFAYTAIFNALGNPSTAIPVGLSSKGLPISIQAVASPYQDHLTLSAAEELEAAFGGWTHPPEPV